MNNSRRIMAGSSRLLVWLGALGLAAMALILCWQVFARYVLQASPGWSEQAALVLTVWFVFLGAAAGVHEGFHIRIEEGVEHMPPGLARLARACAHLAVALFGLILVVWGVELVLRTWGNAVPTLPLSRGMVYLVIPLSGAMICVFSIHKLLSLRAGGDHSPWR